MRVREISGRRILAMPRRPVDCVEDALLIAEEYRRLKLEGAMVKASNGLYRLARDYAWMKLKAKETVDLPVIGAYPGKAGKRFAESLGGVTVNFNGVDVNVGGGFTPPQRDEIWKTWLEDKAQLVGKVAEIEYHEITPDGSLRSPRFKRWRDDKGSAIA
jgi:ATP-dependent DNA ligase